MKRPVVNYTVILFVITLFVACAPKKNPDVPDNAINTDVVKNPTTASSGGNSKDHVPAYKFESTEHDFGTITQGESVSYAFTFTNSGTGDLVIRHASGSCGCTVPEFPKDPIKPGGNGTINVTFNSEGKEGLQHKTVTLIANTLPNTYVLDIKANVIKP